MNLLVAVRPFVAGDEAATQELLNEMIGDCLEPGDQFLNVSIDSSLDGPSHLHLFYLRPLPQLTVLDEPNATQEAED